MKIALFLSALLGCIALAQADCSPACLNGGLCQTDEVSGVSACNCTGTGFSGASCNVAIYCPAASDFSATWPRTQAKKSAQGTCSSGFLGTPRRACLADGSWADPTNLCYDATNTCLESYYGKATFPATTITNYGTGVCDVGYSGSPTRLCSLTGTWSPSVSNPCVRKTCPATTDGNIDWPATTAGGWGLGTCASGYVGSPQRFCNLDGTFGATAGTPCTLGTLQCPANATAVYSFPATNVLDTATGSCQPGYSPLNGLPKRKCNADQTWSTSISPNCVRNTCPAMTTPAGVIFTVSAILGNRLGNCPTGTYPNGGRKPYAYCDIDGNWGSVVGGCS